MPFSESFSMGFSKAASEQPDGSIGALTEQFYSKFGTRDIGSVTEEFNEVMGDWKVGDF